MKQHIALKFLIALLALVAMGCSKSTNTTTGNPLVGLAMTGSSAQATAQNTFKSWPVCLINELFFKKAQALPPPGAMFDAAGNSVSLQTFWINLGEIEFKASETPEAGEVDGEDLAFSGNYLVDVFSSSPQVLAYSSISVTTIRRVKMKLSRVSTVPSGAPASISGNSVFIQGQVGSHQFSYVTDEETEFEVAGPQAVSAVNNKNLLLEFKVANLIKKINMSVISSNTAISSSNRVNATNPCPLIDASANDLFTCFRKGLESEADLARDDDGDYEIDADEDSVK